MLAEDTITLVGLQGHELRTLSPRAEWTFDQRSDSTNQITVTVGTDEATDVVGDMELLFQHRRFVINEVNRTRDTETCEIVADEAQAEMASIEVESFQVEKAKLSAAVTQLLSNTLWTVGTIEDDTRTIYADLQGKKVTELLTWLANQSNQVLSFDSAQRKVSFVKRDMTPSGVVFNYDINMSNIKKTETPPTCTVLHPIGANGLTVANVNHGSELVEDFGWYTSLGMTENEARARFTKRQEWQDERYTVVQNLLNERGCPPNIDSVTQRKKFIFIILYLFSPSSLAGGKMTAGLREEMSRVLGIQSKSTISDNCADVVFLYQNYGDFSGDIEYLYIEIVNRLKFKGLIN